MTFRDDDGNEIETSGEIAMTKQSVSFFNSNIKGDVSTTFQIDNNSVNRKTLGYKGPQMLNQVAYTKQAFSRVRNGNILDRGYIVIQSDNGPTLSCFYVSGNSNWFQLLNGLITELDYSGVTNGKDYTQAFTYTNVIALASSTDGITFPMVDWCFNLNQNIDHYIYLRQNSSFAGTLAAVFDTEVDWKKNLFTLYPCFFLHSLVTEIISQNGLKINGSVLDDKLYKTLVVTPENGNMKRDPFKKVVTRGTSQTFTTGVTAKYTSLVKYSDPDGIFSSSRFTVDRKAAIFFNIKKVAESASLVFTGILYKNGIASSNISFETRDVGETWVTPLIIPVIGDYYEFYFSQVSGSDKSLTIDITMEFNEIINVNDYVDPSHFLPALKSIDVIKFVINFFGCSVYFNDVSKTLSLNIIEKIKQEDAEDWSRYFVANKSKYTIDQAANNYLKWDKNETDSDVIKYNDKHNVHFGDGNITTGNTLKNENDLVKFPFVPSLSNFSKNNSYLLNIPLVNLINDGDPINFTSVASAGVTSTFQLDTALTVNIGPEVLSATDNYGNTYGYFMGTVTAGSIGDLTLDALTIIDVTTGGKIYRQRINRQSVGARIISVTPMPVSSFSSRSSIDIYSTAGLVINAITTINYGTFTKQLVNYGIDQWRNNLAIDNPDSGGFEDPTIKELYFNKISRFLQNPDIEAIMILPEAVYQRFIFDKFIYLETEQLTGYFFVKSIENYIDSNTPVTINLYML